MIERQSEKKTFLYLDLFQALYSDVFTKFDT